MILSLFKRRRGSWLTALPLVSAGMHASATDYLSVSQAQHLMFPQATRFVAQPVASTQATLKLMATKSEEDTERMHLTVWRAYKDDTLLGFFITDAAIGKFELIDYAVALAPDGSIRQVEVLSYRESHGQEVRKKAWLQQFEGKSASNPLQLETDITAISGATLSCSHMTDGLRRITLFARLGLASTPATGRP